MNCPNCGCDVGSYTLGKGCFRCYEPEDKRTREQLIAKLKIAQRELQVMKSCNRAAWKRISEQDTVYIHLLKRWHEYGKHTGCESKQLMDMTEKEIK